MFGLDEDLRSNFNKIFASFPEIEKVIIYGSRAKGNYREGSDIDLCLVGDDLNEASRKRDWLM
ncbi:MAG TPA: nucleotidyltransferase domain-containing protein, partial [Bacteroidales bacterium]|nr:nucleotidyltransferase domain-containing protein [Bacteroidales bacterium]